MTILEKDPSLHNVFWWKPPAHFSWMDFHRAIDDMRGLMSNVAQPVIIAAQPQGDLPAGNAIPHLKRLFALLKTQDSIRYFVIVLDNQQTISKALMLIVLRIYGVPDKFIMVPTLEDAIGMIEVYIDAEVNNNANYA